MRKLVLTIAILALISAGAVVKAGNPRQVNPPKKSPELVKRIHIPAKTIGVKLPVGFTRLQTFHARDNNP